MDPIISIPLALALTVGGLVWRTSARATKAEGKIERAIAASKGAHARIDQIEPHVNEGRRRAARDDERWTHVLTTLERIEQHLRR